MSNPDSSDTQSLSTTDFEALARFLMGPFLDKPEELKFHVEKLAGGKKLWLRAAFNEEEDKGRVFGRGGRNIKAMRNVMMAAAKQSAMTVNLSVFGEPEAERSERGGGGRAVVAIALGEEAAVEVVVVVAIATDLPEPAQTLHLPRKSQSLSSASASSRPLYSQPS